MRFILATKNKGKVKELKEIIKGADIITMDEAGFHDDIEENGKTFEENALIKARAVCKELGVPAMADDSGLEVFALSMRPGIYSARYAGENATDEDRVKKLLSEMDGKEDRRARFVCAAALCMPDGREIVCRGETNGNLLYAPQGTGGFGYDPIFVPVGFDKTFAEIPQEEKNKISHRRRAFDKLSLEIENI
ncbi:MAG: XTP/dITP diphosphatase [Clostridia bacterium]|nr:XTP/dITP diphosphatase [Clostridia bacterium]